MTQKMNNNNHNIELVDELITQQQNIHLHLLRLSEINADVMTTVIRSTQKIRILEQLKKDLLSND